MHIPQGKKETRGIRVGVRRGEENPATCHRAKKLAGRAKHRLEGKTRKGRKGRSRLGRVAKVSGLKG